jgi:hypothetical protein
VNTLSTVISKVISLKTWEELPTGNADQGVVSCCSLGKQSTQQEYEKMVIIMVSWS